MTQERKRRTAAAKTSDKKNVPAVTRRDPTDAERLAIGQARECFADLPERCEMEMAIDDNNGRSISSPHSDAEGYSAHLMATLGSRSVPFVDAAVRKLLGTSGERGKVATQNEANAALAFVSAVAPADELECSMAIQMHATNELALDLLSRAQNSDDRTATAEYANLATKLSRTFAMQVEALAKLRRNGEQVVKHVHVYEGGQAVIAKTINQGGATRGANGRRIEQPHEQAADASFAALPCPDAPGNVLPFACDAERPVPAPRRQKSRRSEGK